MLVRRWKLFVYFINVYYLVIFVRVLKQSKDCPQKLAVILFNQKFKGGFLWFQIFEKGSAKGLVEVYLLGAVLYETEKVVGKKIWKFWGREGRVLKSFNAYASLFCPFLCTYKSHKLCKTQPMVAFFTMVTTNHRSSHLKKQRNFI